MPLLGDENATATNQENVETDSLGTIPDNTLSLSEVESKKLAQGPLITFNFTPESCPSPDIDPSPRSDQDEDALFNTALEKQLINDGLTNGKPLGAIQEEIADHPELAESSARTVKNSTHAISTRTLKPKRGLQPELISLIRAEFQQHGFPATETIETASPAGVPDVKDNAVIPGTQAQGKVALRLHREYLGQQALPVDQVFYGNTMLGQPIIHDSSRVTQQLAVTDDDDDDFHIVSDNTISTGQRLYVSRLMRGFLRESKIKSLVYGKKHLTAIVPYHARINKWSQHPSMTLLTYSEKGFIARRVNRAQWLKYETANRFFDASVSGSLNSQTLELDVQKEESPLLSIGRNEAHDYEFLEKWEHQADDRILPAYGDSGSEGEYDLDTWQEMELKKGQLNRILAPSSQNRLLGAERVEEIIDSAETAFKERWRLQKLPKLKPKEWPLWKSRRNNTYHYRLQLFVSETRRLDRQFLRIKKQIREEQWTSEAKLKAQCNSFEVSVTDRETYCWKVSVLQSNSEPPKPLPQQCPRKGIAKHIQEPLQEPLQEGEEDVGSSSTEGESSDNDVDDFIVSEDESDEHEVSSDLADSENNIDSPDSRDGEEVSDATVLTAESPLTASRRSIVLRKKTALSEKDAAKPEPLPSSPVPKVEKGSPGKFKLPNKNTGSSGIIPIALTSSPVRPSVPEIIDLTNLSDADEPASQQGKRIATPPIFVEAEADDPFSRPTNAKGGFRMPPAASSEVESSIESVTVRKQSPNVSFDKFPPLHEIGQIAKLNPELLKQASDRERLLIWIIGRTATSPRQEVLQLLKAQTDTDILQLYMWQGMRALENGTDLPEDLTWDELSIDQGQVYMRLATWFVCWSQCTITFPQGFPEDSPAFTRRDVTQAVNDDAKFMTFYETLKRSLQYYTDKSQSKLPSSSPSVSASQKKRIRRVTSGSEESDNDRTSKRKRRVFEVPESQQALELQRSGKQRLEQQNKRQKEMDERMKRLGETGDIDHTTAKVVNTSANPDQGIVVIPRHISLKIQSHQLDGVRFMWREVVAAEQGCLLAHTMGLGKTMQVITLLVTIAQAAKSEDESLRAQIPERLKSSKTLILAPPTLIDNWFDEFLMWAPDRSESIGTVYKVGSDLKLEVRLSEIELWDEKGGVLLMGYDGFRNLINPKNNKLKGRKSGTERVAHIEERYKALNDVLLTHPNLVVLDEAHTVKRSSSKISKAVAQFQSTYRIALTGSPLSNNLEEYYELVSWISPGYLGTHPEFRAKYGEPITLGLYADSTACERRKCLVKLRTLSIKLAPKMQRQDIGVLKKQLSKTEFVVYVPLTPTQRDAYVLYANALLSATSGKDPPPSKIWGALSVLRLLCNHPKCFKDKLEAAKKELQDLKKAIDPVPEDPNRAVIEDDEESILDDAAEVANTLLPNIGMTEEMMNEQLDIFKNIGKSIARTDLSNKMLVLMRIIAFSEEAQDKVLVFSHSIPTLDFIEKTLKKRGHNYVRLDGMTPMKSRNQLTKRFNTRKAANVCLISTRAGGQGLNLYGANRVVIVDDYFNPMHEEQAIGRAYRIGQEKHVYVYRLTIGGTFEETIQNQSLFKIQLATRVVDKKHNNRLAMSSLREYLQVPRDLVQTDLTELQGKDELVLDRVLADAQTSSIIRSIIPSETFKDLEPLTAEEEKEVEENVRLENLSKTDPVAYRLELDRHETALQQKTFSDIRAQDSADFHPMTALKPDQSNNYAPQVYPRGSTDDAAAHLRATRVAPLGNLQHSQVNDLQSAEPSHQQPHRFSEKNVPISNGVEPGLSSTDTSRMRHMHSPSVSVLSRASESSLSNGSKHITERERIRCRDRFYGRMTLQLSTLSIKRIFEADNARELCERLACRMEEACRQKAGGNSQAYRKHVHDTEKWVQNKLQALGKALQVEKRQAKTPTGLLAREASGTPRTTNITQANSLPGSRTRLLEGSGLSESIKNRASSSKPASLLASSAKAAYTDHSKGQQTAPPGSNAIKDVGNMESSVDGAGEKKLSPSDSTAPKVRPISAQLSKSTPSLYPSLQALLAREQQSHKLPSKR